ncbi:hypothetical protein M9Y10_025230 [Tritrichomonas musculus]|uniref:Ankyrin repeat protein n=1 Tax=Tritrichomonas musculus TaxID=1915356 RepID=A0ABR2HAX2_9EUKA
MFSQFYHQFFGGKNYRTIYNDNKSTKSEESINKFNLEILDSILDDNEEKFMNLIKGNDNCNINKTFRITNYRLPVFLNDNPPYSSLCACFGSEKCFKSLSHLLPCGSEEFLKLDDFKRSPIHFACIGGSIAIIRELEQAGVSMNIQDKYGFYPCHYAAMSGHLEVMKYLMMKGIDILTSSSTHGPQLLSIHVACLYGSINIVKLIIETASSKYQLDSLLVKKSTPLHFACIGGQYQIVEFIQRYKEFYKKQFDVCNEESMTPLVCACKAGSLECVKLILKKSKIDLNMIGRKHHPLIEAASNGHIDIVKFLLEQNNTDIKQESSQRCAALDEAISKGYFDIVKLLIENGAAIDSDLDLLMMKVISKGDQEMIHYFDDHFKIHYNKIFVLNTTYGDKYMERACNNKDEKTIDFLLSKNVEFSKINVAELIKSKEFDLLNLLLKKGLNVANYSNPKESPLVILMIKNGSFDDVINLIKKSAPFNNEMITKYNCIEIACEHNDLKLFDYLMSYKPTISQEDKYNYITITLRESRFENKDKKEESLKMIDTLLNFFNINFKNSSSFMNSLVTQAINKRSVELLDILLKYGADYSNCLIDFSTSFFDSYVPVFQYLKDHGCTFNHMKYSEGFQNNPLSYILYNAEYLNFSDFLQMVTFMMDFTSPENIMNAKHREFNLIDYFMEHDYYEGVSKAFTLTKSVFYPLRNSSDAFTNWIKKSQDLNLIRMVIKH